MYCFLSARETETTSGYRVTIFSGSFLDYASGDGEVKNQKSIGSLCFLISFGSELLWSDLKRLHVPDLPHTDPIGKHRRRPFSAIFGDIP